MTSHPSKPRLVCFKDWISLMFCGFFMGIADIVPGISGGTVAFILGIYEDLLKSITSINLKSFSLLLRLRFASFFREIGWEFLLALGSGIAIAFLTLAHFFDFLLNHEIYRAYLYSSFLGLIVASIIFCAKQIPQWKFTHCLALLLGAIAAFALTDAELTPASKESFYNVRIDLPTQNSKHIRNYEEGMLLNVPESTLAAMLAKEKVSLSTPVYHHQLNQEGTVADFVKKPSSQRWNLWLIFCGAVAITAMLLPGISGSYMLTILSVYATAIGALADFIRGLQRNTLEADAFYILANLVIGMLVGALLFSRVVRWLLHHHRHLTIATLTGFMVGALRCVWPFWSYHYILLPLRLEKGPVIIMDNAFVPESGIFFLYSCLFAIGGFCLVISLEKIKNQINIKQNASLNHELAP